VYVPGMLRAAWCQSLRCSTAVLARVEQDNFAQRPCECRYCYKGQIEAVQWNLAQFATALLATDLCTQEEAQEAVNRYGARVLALHNQGMAQKMGLQEYNETMVTSFLRLMYAAEADFTNTFRALAKVGTTDEFDRIPDALLAALGKAPDEDMTKVRALRAYLSATVFAIAASSDVQSHRFPRGVLPPDRLLPKG
jgi:uncharacterized protein YdiU (UPF0061 family)